LSCQTRKMKRCEIWSVPARMRWHDRQRARLRLRSFLLRQGHSYTGRRWGPAHRLFLSKIKFQDPSHHIAFTEYRLAVHVCTECVERLEAALRAEAQSWRSLPMIKALMTLRGIDFLSATTIAAELGDLRRFPHPRELRDIWDWRPANIQADRRNTAANSPEPAIRMYAGS
jgi:transposase